MFRSGWEKKFYSMADAEESCIKHQALDDKNKKLLSRWEDSILDAEKYLNYKSTKEGTQIQGDPKLSKRFDFIHQQRNALAQAQKTQAQFDQKQAEKKAEERYWLWLTNGVSSVSLDAPRVHPMVYDWRRRLP